jgi:hypothetical protein
MKKLLLFSLIIFCCVNSLFALRHPQIPEIPMSFQEATNYCYAINKRLPSADELLRMAKNIARANLKCPHARFITSDGFEVFMSQDCRGYVNVAYTRKYDVICVD